MRVRSAIVVVVLGCVAGLAPPALAATTDTRGPACADITDGAGTYDAGTQTVLFRMNTRAPSCTRIIYTLYVYTADGTTLLTQQAKPGDGGVDPVTGLPALVFTITDVTVDTGTVPCVVGTTASSGGHLFDRAPDAGCFDLSTGGGKRFG